MKVETVEKVWVVVFKNKTKLSMLFEGSDVYLTLDKAHPVPVDELLELAGEIEERQSKAKPAKMPRSLRGPSLRGPGRRA